MAFINLGNPLISKRSELFKIVTCLVKNGSKYKKI